MGGYGKKCTNVPARIENPHGGLPRGSEDIMKAKGTFIYILE